MKLQMIKDKLDIPQFNLNTAQDAEGAPTAWMRHWDNTRRIAVSVHKDLVATIKSNPALDTLDLQHQVKTGEQGSYQAYRIVAYKEAEETI